ncbi:hypothetical protein GCK72_006604 [Caenorhabditis remanei]|uniref:Uncharacterized protein n=1 Tax=Caenorhabditis remanei TaxID=31234 RepID=A0A6A5HIY1_CAERE|nr:hypothetical protein GCK72_006604 [Caenorhabditis remanei]KAF1766646.1 hypothetical protein GCK72_006604 [Caenorhabditis remanei]
MSAEMFDIVVEYTEKVSSRHCSPTPSTSSSSPASSSSASSSGSASPSNVVRQSTRVRRLSKTKKSLMTSLRRSSRKILTVGKKYAKKFTSSSSKHRLVKYKIDKQYQQQLAESKARVERLKREREDLLAGNSQTAILCEEVTTQARSLRESYERQRPGIYRAVLSAFLEQEEEDDYDDVEAGFIGTFYY